MSVPLPRRLRLAQLALGSSALISLLLALFIPFPPQGWEWLSLGLLLAVLVGGMLGIYLISRQRRLAIGVITVLGAYGALVVIRGFPVFIQVTSEVFTGVAAAAYDGPAKVLAIWMAYSMGVGLVVAAAGCLSARGRDALRS